MWTDQKYCIFLGIKVKNILEVSTNRHWVSRSFLGVNLPGNCKNGAILPFMDENLTLTIKWKSLLENVRVTLNYHCCIVTLTFCSHTLISVIQLIKWLIIPQKSLNNHVLSLDTHLIFVSHLRGQWLIKLAEFIANIITSI